MGSGGGYGRQNQYNSSSTSGEPLRSDEATWRRSEPEPEPAASSHKPSYGGQSYQGGDSSRYQSSNRYQSGGAGGQYSSYQRQAPTRQGYNVSGGGGYAGGESSSRRSGGGQDDYQRRPYGSGQAYGGGSGKREFGDRGYKTNDGAKDG